MSIPYRGQTSAATYFVTAGVYNKMRLLQSERMAGLFCHTLLRYRDDGRLRLHSFVVMPDHIHLLLTVPEGQTLERTMQFIKGGFSHDAGRQFGIRGPIWQKSFVDRRVRDATEYRRFREYIDLNPVKAGLVEVAEAFEYSSARGRFRLDDIPQWLKPASETEFVMHR